MEKKVTARKYVIEKYPYAYAKKWKQQWSKDVWTIWNNDKGHMSGLGTGYTQQLAWEDAMKKLQEFSHK